MIDQKKRTYQSQTLSLLTLKLILTEAKKESPPQMRKEEQSDEELALNLIVSMKKKYKKAMSLRGAFVPGTARQGRCATKQSPRPYGECSPALRAGASVVGIRPPRNDIMVEP